MGAKDVGFGETEYIEDPDKEDETREDEDDIDDEDNDDFEPFLEDRIEE